MPNRIVILGAGYAGIEAALTLHKKGKKSGGLEITVIDRNSDHILLTELHEVAGNRVEEDGVRVPLRDIFKYTSVKLVKDEITKVDYENKKLLSDSSQYEYDYLILAAGSEPNYFGIAGLKEYAFPLWAYEDAIRIREHIKDCFIKASQTEDPEKRRRLLTFAVGGAGFTGIEMIGELAHWTRDLCREYGFSQYDTRLLVIEALPRILINLRIKSAKKAVKYLVRKLKVEIRTNSIIAKVDQEAFELRDGTRIDCNTLIWTAGVRASKLTDSANFNKDRSSRVIVNRHTQTQYPNVYAAGDISAFTSYEGTLPSLVEGALQTGSMAAENILADIRGKEKDELEPKLHGVMVSIGSHFAVADVMKVQWPRLISIILKHLVNIHYLFGIGGFEQVLRYLKREFLGKRQNTNIVEKHISAVTPAFWMLPVRLFLGYSWLKEGFAKLNEGWLVKAVLAGLPADTGSSASITDTGEKVFRIISENTPSWYVWIANHIVLPHPMLFQILIVITEIGLGLAFLSGTFTFIASFISLGLIANFMLSTGFYDYNWWFIPAAIVLLGGSGRTFGADHYIMPWLMRKWRYFVRNRGGKFLPGLSADLKVILLFLLVIAVFAVGFIYNEFMYYGK